MKDMKQEESIDYDKKKKKNYDANSFSNKLTSY